MKFLSEFSWFVFGRLLWKFYAEYHDRGTVKDVWEWYSLEWRSKRS